MPARLAQRLDAARQRRFVGRAAEQAVFQSALAARELPFQLLYIFGPGGVGKTTLLNAYAAQCEQAQLLCARLDARTIEPIPEAFAGALRLALQLSPSDPPLPDALTRAERAVLLLDTCENLAPLDGWLRDSFLPQLPENTLVVMAGRQPLAPAWHADPGWQALIRTVPLRNLTSEESRAYLLNRAVPAEEHPAVLGFTHGHPLALSLVADALDQRPGQHFQPHDAPNIVKALLEQLMQKAPSPAHRAALEACALVHLLTEALLAEMLATPDAHELFDWLRGLSFIEAGPLGLFPHDLAREALAADVRWRNPDWYAELHQRARQYYTARLPQTVGLEQQRALFDLIFLHRDNAVVRAVFEWQAGGTLLVDTARPADHPILLAMIEHHEGAEAARLAQTWLTQPGLMPLVLREADGQTAGLAVFIQLAQARPEAIQSDPATRAVTAYLQRAAPLRSGEAATLFRFWMARDTYQSVSPAQSLIFVAMVRHYLTTPGLAFTFLPCAEPEFWAPAFAYADLTRLPEADFETGGKRFGVYGHDWRLTPPGAWLALLAEREMGASPAAAPATAETLLVLSADDFAEAVREALRDLARPSTLVNNPLLRSRLVLERAGPDRVAALQSLLRAAADSLRAAPRDAKLYRALDLTYLHPAPTQEQAAEQLDLPFSTYRRHLKAGLQRVTEILWQREIGNAPN